MPASPRPTSLRLLVLAASAAVALPLLGGGAALADEGPAAGDTIVGELLQAWPEHEEPHDAAVAGAEGPLTWIGTGDGEPVRVASEDVAELPVGATVEVTVGEEVPPAGPEEADLEPALEVLAAEVVAGAPLEPPVSPSTDGTTNAVTVVRAVPPGTTDAAPLADVVAAVNGPVAQFWSDQSGGAVQIAVTGSADWSPSTIDCSRPHALWDAAAAHVGWERAPGQHLLLYLPRNSPGCAYGLAEVGSSLTTGGRLYVRDTATSVIAHELGHHFGLGHSSAWQCHGSVETGGCRTVPYGDYYDVMGVSWDQVGSLNAPQAALVGLLPPERMAAVTATGPGGTFTLAPVSSGTGIRALRLTQPDGLVHWLEYRPAAGQDAWLGTAGNWPRLQAGVFLRRGGAGNDTSLLLDPTPSLRAAWDSDRRTALPVGTAVAVGSATVVVHEVTASGATVQVVPGPAGTPLLVSEQALTGGEALLSGNGRYRAVTQPDGNFVVYAWDGRPIWNARTMGNDGARVVLQGDGNLVVYAASGRALWSARTDGSPGARAVLQDDGNLVVYRADGRPAWWSGQDAFEVLRGGQPLAGGQSLVSADGRYRAAAQPDGNLVVYAWDGRVLWNARTHGNAGARTVMQGDGNLVVYATSGRALWNAGTYGNAGARLVMQDDGNLVLYRPDNRPVWWTGQDPAR